MAISTEEKLRQTERIAKELKALTSRHVLAIYKVLDKDYGELNGSGNLIEIANSLYVMSAKHVIEDILVHPMAMFSSQGQIPFRLSNAIQYIERPRDLAISRLEDTYRNNSQKEPILVSKLAHISSDLQGDLLLIIGCPGERSRFHALVKGISSEIVPYATVLHEDKVYYKYYDPSIHFAVEYRAEGAKDESGKVVALPFPGGYSGSLVWAARINKGPIKEWKPEKSEIVGLVHTWDQDAQCLICTRIEVIREFLKEAIHKERAYFNWLSRHCPQGDSLADWLGVESNINKIFA